VKFDFIAAENANQQFEVSFMCRELGVSKSGFYAYVGRGTTQRRSEDLELAALVTDEFRKHPRGCGSRMIRGALRARGHIVGRNRVRRLMKQEKLCHRLKRRFVCTTRSRRDDAFADNVVDRDFQPGARDRIWASDITYVPTRRGWAYLAVVLDVGSRRVVGWQVGTTMEESLVLDALRQAIEQRRPAPGLVHHSDRGTQYNGEAHRWLLAEHGMICSMSRRGNCWDNACVESFFSTLKRELPQDGLFDDVHHLERAVFAYIDAFYNTRRPHSALGYRTPNEYEQLRNAS